VLANLEHLVIKATFAAHRFEPIFGARLSRQQRQELAERLRARPHHFVAQEQLPLSTTPVLVGGRLQPRHLLLRTFLAASDGTFTIMPGGLTRVTASADTMVVSMQKGGGSKDTWVLSSGPVNTFSMLDATVQPVELSRGGSDLPSRAADNLFWLGRHAERSDALVRLLRGILVRLTEQSGLGEAHELPVLLRALTELTHTHPGFVNKGAEGRLTAPEAEVLAVVFDATRPGSLSATLSCLRRVAGMARDRISTDMWRVLTSLDLDAPAGSGDTLSDVLDLLNRIVSALAAFGGLAVESMTRSQGWRFLDMGRRLERSLQIITLLRATLVSASAHEGPVLEALLEIADSSMTYRRRYLSSLQTAPVLDLLLADESNPRSLAFQLAALAASLDELPREAALPGRSPEQRLMLEILTALRLADVDELAQAASTGARPQLDSLLAHLGRELPVLSDTITHSYLSHLQASRHLASFSPDPAP
jgi:uncharacterized alpha-E superfamily protein